MQQYCEFFHSTSNNHLTAKFLQNMLIKKFKNRSTFGKDQNKSLKLTFCPHLR